MATNLQLIANKQATNAKKLLLVDALGGLLSVALLTAVVARFERYFGMPQHVVYFLSFLAGIYVMYSFGCYFFMQRNQAAFLKPIAIANLMYSCITIALIYYFYQKLTILGFMYFFVEAIIVLVLGVAGLKLNSKSLN